MSLLIGSTVWNNNKKTLNWSTQDGVKDELKASKIIRLMRIDFQKFLYAFQPAFLIMFNFRLESRQS